jgi:hypothetical protein
MASKSRTGMVAAELMRRISCLNCPDARLVTSAATILKKLAVILDQKLL